MGDLNGPAEGPAWAEQDQQDVRPYALTGGRTRPRHVMRRESLLAATDVVPPDPLAPEAEQARQLCRGEPRPVAEIAATIGQPIQVTKILLSDLIDLGVMTIAVPDTTSRGPFSGPDRQLLEEVIAGLHTYTGVA